MSLLKIWALSLWCDEHKRGHIRSWSDLLLLRNEAMLVDELAKSLSQAFVTQNKKYFLTAVEHISDLD